MMKYHYSALFVWILSTGFILSACTTLSADRGVEPRTLADTRWQLQSLDDTPPVPETEITIEFSEGQISGSAGCNSYGGSYQVNDGQLAIGEVFATERFCQQPEGVMDQESRYLEILRRVNAFEFDGETLTLMTEQGESLMFESQGAEDGS